MAAVRRSFHRHPLDGRCPGPGNWHVPPLGRQDLAGVVAMFPALAAGVARRERFARAISRRSVASSGPPVAPAEGAVEALLWPALRHAWGSPPRAGVRRRHFSQLGCTPKEPSGALLRRLTRRRPARRGHDGFFGRPGAAEGPGVSSAAHVPAVAWPPPFARAGRPKKRPRAGCAQGAAPNSAP